MTYRADLVWCMVFNARFEIGYNMRLGNCWYIYDNNKICINLISSTIAVYYWNNNQRGRSRKEKIVFMVTLTKNMVLVNSPLREQWKYYAFPFEKSRSTTVYIRIIKINLMFFYLFKLKHLIIINS